MSEPPITFRDYIQVLVQQWRLVVGVTVVGSVLIVIVALLVTDVYAARSSLALTDQTYNIVFDDRIESLGEQLSYEVISSRYFTIQGIANQDSTLQTVLDRLDPPLEGRRHRLKYIAGATEAVLTNNGSLIELVVTSDNPEEGARIANVWADVVLEQANFLFDEGDVELALLQSQFDDAIDDRAVAEANFQDFRATDNREVIRSELHRITSDYEYYFYERRFMTILQSDLQNYRQVLQERDGAAMVSFQDELVLLNFQLRTYTNLDFSGEMLTLEGVVLDTTSERTVRDFVAVIDEMIVTYDVRLEQVDVQLADLEAQELELRVQLGDLDFEVGYLGERVDLARNNYQVLQRKIAEAEIDSVINRDPVQLAAPAVPSVIATGLTDRLMVLIGGVVSLLLGVAAAYIRAYWHIIAKDFLAET